MAEIINTDGTKPSKEQRIEILVSEGMTRGRAEFVIALVDGEIDGDVIIVDASKSQDEAEQ